LTIARFRLKEKIILSIALLDYLAIFVCLAALHRTGRVKITNIAPLRKESMAAATSCLPLLGHFGFSKIETRRKKGIILWLLNIRV
jgi:hypothetical protein